MSSETTLVSLAMLSVNREELKTDYITYFVPFSLHALAPYKKQPVTDVILRNQLITLFGLSIPIASCNTILQRLAKLQYIESHREFYTFTSKPINDDLSAKRAEAEARTNNLIGKIIGYSTGRLPAPLTEPEVRAAITDFLGRFSIDCLRSFTQHTALPATAATHDAHLALLGAFTRDAAAKEQATFEDLILLVKGNMLANALLCPDINSKTTNFKNIQFFFDTPLILCALDVQMPTRCDAIRDLLKVLRKLGGITVVFSHTIDEVDSVLRGAIGGFDYPDNRSRIVTEAKRAGRKKGDLIMIHHRLASKLEELGLNRVPTPKYEVAFQIDEAVLQGTLEADIYYHNPAAVAYDVNSIRSIYVYRRGKSPQQVENCSAIFVTSNHKLARAAYDHGANHESSKNVSPAITDFSLANLAWLKSPVDAPNVPRLELLATCYAALSPPEKLWRKYVHEVDRLVETGQISADDHAALRSHLVSDETLIYLTDGSDERLEGETVLEVLARIKRGLIEDKDKEINAVKARQDAAEAEIVRIQARERIVDARVQSISYVIAWIPISFVGSVLIISLMFEFGVINRHSIGSGRLLALGLGSIAILGFVIDFCSTFIGFVPSEWLARLHKLIMLNIAKGFNRLLARR